MYYTPYIIRVSLLQLYRYELYLCDLKFLDPSLIDDTYEHGARPSCGSKLPS